MSPRAALESDVFAIYLALVAGVLRVQTENYPYFLLTGLLPWGFFAGALMASTRAITGNGTLLRKVHFPPEVLPIGTVLFAFSQLLLGFGAFLPLLLLVSGARLHWTVVLVVPLFILHLVFTIGIALILSAATVFLRDVQHLTEVTCPTLAAPLPAMSVVRLVPDTAEPKLAGGVTVARRSKRVRRRESSGRSVRTPARIRSTSWSRRITCEVASAIGSFDFPFFSARISRWPRITDSGVRKSWVTTATKSERARSSSRRLSVVLRSSAYSDALSIASAAWFASAPTKRTSSSRNSL